MPQVRTRWDPSKARRAADRLASGLSVKQVLRDMSCSEDRLRSEVKAVMGEAWWAEHVRSRKR